MTILESSTDAASQRLSAGWVELCGLDDLEVERGRAALVGETQVALFLLPSGEVHAVSNLDPYSGAHVISRGIVGTRQGTPTVASPMYKQVFELPTGICVDTQGKPPGRLNTWPVSVASGRVFLKWWRQT